MGKKFEIEYVVVLRDGNREEHVTKVGNCEHDAHAKAKLGKWCEQKYADRGYLTMVVVSCEDVTSEEFISYDKNIFGAGEDMFNRIFGGFNKRK